MNKIQLDEINKKIRYNLRITDETVINIPQSGYFSGKILWIFQNPAVPIVGKHEDDILADLEIPFDRVEEAYKNTLYSSKLGEFIKLFYKDWSNISITNVVKFPTKDNSAPRQEIIDICLPYLLQQIEALDPILIITVGSIPTQVLLHKSLSSVELQQQKFNNYNVLPIYHYSYLIRINKDLKQYSEKVKEKISLILNNTFKQTKLV